MKRIKKNLKWITLIVVVLLFCGCVFIKYSLLEKENVGNVIEESILDEMEIGTEDLNDEIIQDNSGDMNANAQTSFFVDIKGAVVNPGVYEVMDSVKVIDVVNLAGGFTSDADTTMINLAKKVYNEMVIIIYTRDEVEKAGEQDSIIKVIEKECVCPEINNDACLNSENDKSEISSDDNILSEKININSADIVELLTLPGIGESKANAIIEYRNNNGYFQNIEDIKMVSGIGESLYEKIKDYITV